MILPRASLKRSTRTRTRMNTASAEVRQKTRPPPLQIIPELSENELAIDAILSPATARPMHFTPQQPEPVSSRITLSAYTFSIDDALLMFGGDAPGSPALSASSSTSNGTSSEDVPSTPVASDDDDEYNFALPTPRFRPQRISIRPLCITKTRSLICHEDEEIYTYFEKEEKVPVTDGIPEYAMEAKATSEATEEADQDFYTREFEDFVSLFPAMPSPTGPARRDSLVLAPESLPVVVEALVPKSRGRSRHSKPLPLLPPTTPPISTFPNAPLVQIAAQKSVVRRKRNIAPFPNQPPLQLPVASRPLPRMGIPLDVEDCVFPEEALDASSRRSIASQQAYDIDEDATIYSQPYFTYTAPTSSRPLPPAIPETPLSGMYGEVTLPRSSTDSDAPRSSIDSTSSVASSAAPSSLSFPSSPSSEERLCSRWSTSTLGSLAIEPPRSTTLLSPLRSVFGSRARRMLPSPPKMTSHLTPPKLPKSKHGFSATPSPPSTSGKHIRRQGSRSSTSSVEASPPGRGSRDRSPSGLKRKPIPVAMFLRVT